MALRLKTTNKPGLSATATPYRVTLKNGKTYNYGSIRAIQEDLKPEEIESIYDRHKHRYHLITTLGHRSSKKGKQ